LALTFNLDTFKKNRNNCQFKEKNSNGHYESYFLRANHPTKAQGFWFRYTIFSPKNPLTKRLGEIWAVFFDGENSNITAVKEEFPLNDCSFSTEEMKVKIGTSLLQSGELSGSAHSDKKHIHWQLTYQADKSALVFLPPNYYQKSFPKAKSFVGNPNTLFKGVVTVNGENYPIEQWQGSENHNWGSKHTDEYAWGQVAGFDNDQQAFLECITARVKIGPLWTPKMTIVCLRLNGEDYYFNTIKQALKAKGHYTYFDWYFSSTQNGITIKGRIYAKKDNFVGLNYYNPPGGSNTCLNSKIAACELSIEGKGLKETVLTSVNRAAFEILTADDSHGVTVLA